MSQTNQGQTSSAPLIHHVIKKKRGRPRKDRSLQHNAAIHLPPGFGSAKEHTRHTSDANYGFDPMVGQPVTGIVEATFDAGYLLNVRIGNSTANLRGLIFKPGCYVPITPENDIAPHMQMIKGNESNTHSMRQGWPQNPSFSTQAVRTKRKYKSRRRVDSVPANLDQSVAVSQLFVRSQAPIGQQLSEASGEDEGGLNNKGASEVGRNCNAEDESKSMAEDPRTVSKIEDGSNNLPFSTESLQPTNFASKPLFSYGAGKMTELLQAVQENAKDIQARAIASKDSMKLESHEPRS